MEIEFNHMPVIQFMMSHDETPMKTLDTKAWLSFQYINAEYIDVPGGWCVLIPQERTQNLSWTLPGLALCIFSFSWPRDLYPL